jgi:hypothetical protein
VVLEGQFFLIFGFRVILAYIFCSHSGDEKLLLERFKSVLNYTDAFSFVADFYTRKQKTDGSVSGIVTFLLEFIGLN